jgi:hypothetical protein
VANEQVRLDVQVDALAAIKQLRQIAESAESGDEAVKRLSMFLLKMSKETKVPLEQLRRTIQGINNELSRTGQGSFFSGFDIGDKGIFQGEKAYTAAAQAAGRFQTAQNGVVTSVNKGNKALDEADRAARGYGHGIDIIRTAMGTLLAVGIFQFLNAISAAFTQLLHNIRETELAIYNLVNAEKRLSEQGIEVTPKGLQEIIDSVRELVPVLSQIQAEELVSRIATNVAPALKLTNEQIKQMAEATALLYIRNKALGKSFDEVESQLTNAFLTGKVSQGINNLGVKINDQIVKDEALRLGLVKTEEQFNNLTGEMESQVKAAAMLSVVYKNATEDVESLDEYMKTSDAQISRVEKAWSDLLTTLGSSGGSKILAAVLGLLADSLEGWIKLFTDVKPIMVDFFATWTAAIETVLYLMQNPMQSVLFADIFAHFKSENVESMMSGLADAIDTPTAAVENLGEAVDNLDIEGLEEKIEDILEDTARAREDLAKNAADKLADLNEEYRRKALDAELDYNRKIEDINRDAERDIAKVKEKHREQDKRDEEKYQLALWELRMRFLMDLEDALHARDARQVIRLQKQYNLDKEALAKKHALEGKERENSQKNELEDIEQRRQERLEDARIEYEQKLADQRIAKQRELQDLATWYAREQADIEEAQRRKMETLLKGWVDEQKITEANAAQVYAILAKYFGPGGMTDALYQYMMQSLINSTQGAISAAMTGFSLGGGLASTPSTSTEVGEKGSKTGGGGGKRRGRKEGGSLLATRRTSVEFGESGAELATFTPLNRIGRDEGKLDVIGSLGGGGSRVEIGVTLSPDLQARIMEETMDNVGEVILRVNGTKV